MTARRVLGGLLLAAAAACAPVVVAPPRDVNAAHTWALRRTREAPDDRVAWRTAGLAAWAQGKLTEARAALARAADGPGGDLRARWALGAVEAAMGDDQTARERFRAALEDALTPSRGEPRAVRIAVALAALEALADDGGTPRAGDLALLDALIPPAPLSRETTPAIARARLALAERAAPSRRQELATLRGCAPAARVVGPTTPTPLVVLATAPPLRAPVTPEEGPRAELRAAGCVLDVASPDGRPGLVLAEAWLSVAPTPAGPRALTVEVRVDDDRAPARVWLDDVVVATRAATGPLPPREVAGAVLARPGMHRVVVELAVDDGATPLTIIARDAESGSATPIVWLSSPGKKVTEITGKSAAPAATKLAQTPAPVDDAPGPLDVLLATTWRAEHALTAGDPTQAARLADALLTRAPTWTHAAGIAARVALVTPGPSRAVARALARGVLAPAITHTPEDVAAGRRYGELSGGGAAGACTLVARALTQASAATLPARREAAERVVACDPDATALADLEQEAGATEAELDERRRLAGRRPSDPARWVALGRAHLRAGHLKEATAVFDAARRAAPADVDAALGAADVRALGGDVPGAITLLAEAFRRAPGRRELRAALAALGAPDPLAPLRVDGRALHRAWLAERVRRPDPGTPAVLLLDRQATLALDDGARLVITHVIVEIRSKAGADRWGELAVPDGAEVLTARTLKADGTTREPEALDKEGVTAPELEAGDAVELELLEVLPPAPWAAGFQAEPFHFGVAGVPTWRAELVILAPSSLGARAWTLHGAPPVDVTTGLESLAWAGPGERLSIVGRGLAPLRLEPLGPPPVEVVPTAIWLAGPVDRDAPAWLVEKALSVRRTSPALVAEARRQAAGCRSAPACARALGTFVQRTIDDGPALGEDPAIVLARRRGSRPALLIALLEALGHRAELVLARTARHLGASPVVGAPLVWVGRGSPDGVVVDLRDRGLAFGARGGDLAGATATVAGDPRGRARSVAAATRDVVLPPAHAGERRVHVDLQLEATGGARGKIEEILTGEAAARWRDSLRARSPREAAAELEERVIAYHLPGASVGELTAEGIDDPDAPLIVRYEVDVPRYVRADGGVPLHPFPLELVRRTVVLPERVSPLVVPDAWPGRFVVRLEPPDGVRLGGPIVERTIDAPGGSARLTVRARPDGRGFVTTFDETLTPGARVAPADYAAWRDFAAAFDALEATQATLGAGQTPPAARVPPPSAGR